MRIIENVETIVTVQDLKGIVCNKCGDVFNLENIDSCPIQQINLYFGYESKFDNQKWGIDLCENCLLDIIKSFKIVPDNFMSDPSYTSSFDTDAVLHQDLFENWKSTNEWNCEDENPYKNYFIEDFEPNENIDTRKVALHKGFKIVK